MNNQPMYQQNTALRCPNCGGYNMNVQIINEVTLKNQHHSIWWWIFIGWWWIFIKWLIFTVPALLFKLFGHKKQKAVNEQKKIAVCQQCGYSMEIK